MTLSLTQKRQNLAARMVLNVQALDDAINELNSLKAERAALTQDFQDTDFGTGIPVVIDGIPVRIDHLDAYTAGSVFDFGVTPFNTAYTTGSVTLGTGNPTPQSVILKARQ